MPEALSLPDSTVISYSVASHNIVSSLGETRFLIEKGERHKETTRQASSSSS